jgi:hypothetical protein
MWMIFVDLIKWIKQQWSWLVFRGTWFKLWLEHQLLWGYLWLSWVPQRECWDITSN